MNRSMPEPLEASLPQSGQSSGLRTSCYAVLALLVATGAWIRFSDRIAAVVPSLAAPGSTAPQPDQVRGLVELGLIPVAATNAAVQAMALPATDEAALRLAISRRQMRLVQMPLFERDGGSGAIVQVNANGLTRIVHLTAEPTVVTVPMAQVGTVSFRLIGGSSPPGGVGIGAITLVGPVALPSLAAGDLLEVGIVAQ